MSKSAGENPYWYRYLVTDPALVTKVIREEHINSRGFRLHLDVYQLFPLDYCRGIYDRLTCLKRFELIPGADHLIFAPPYLDRSLPPVVNWFRETLR